MNENRAFQIEAAEYFRDKGYEIEITREQKDWGIDAFAIKGQEKIAIQAKNYGYTSRKINRRALFELYGAMKYFDCSHCAIVTNGVLLDTAKTVAKKMKIEIIILNEHIKAKSGNEIKSQKEIEPPLSETNKISFAQIWNTYIRNLAGIVLTGATGLTNEIIHVDESGLTRITKNGKQSFIPIEAFQWAINRIFIAGYVERDEINQEFAGRLSSGVILVLSNLPMFNIQTKPILKVILKSNTD